MEEHLLDPARFWTAVAPPSVALSERSFSLRDSGRLHQRRYWRGPSWVSSAWRCWLGLVRLGYREAADELARRLGRALAASGRREYHDPHTGAGMGARDFGWSALALETLGPWPESARTSHLTDGAPPPVGAPTLTSGAWQPNPRSP